MYEMFPGKRSITACGIRDERWTSKDKLEQYRGILKLHGREKRLRSQDAVKLKKKISWQLGSFQTDVKKFRDIVHDISDGIAENRTRRLLHYRRDLRLKYSGRKTQDIYEGIYQDSHLKRRQLDKLRYEKKTKMKKCFELQLEHAKLSNDYTREQDVPSIATDRLQQLLIMRFQQSVAKQNAAKAIRSTYLSMIDLLKKDAIYHERFLNTLKKDQISQCQVILKTTVMGQLAAEESNDIVEKYKLMTRNVWNNMKERERSLTVAREQVRDLWTYAQSLIRTESDAVFLNISTNQTINSSITLETQIQSFEDIFEKVKDSLLVRSYRELFSRLEEQMKQRTRLLAQFERNVKERDSLFSKKNYALSILSNAEQVLISTTEKCNTDTNALIEQTAIKKKREIDSDTIRKARGQLLMDVRAALQNMVAMLVCVKKGSKAIKRPAKDTDKKMTKEKEIEDKDDVDEQEEETTKSHAPIIERVETEGLALLSTVSRKVGALFGMSNFELDKDKADRAKDLYQTYVSNYGSKLKFHNAGLEQTGFFVEHQVVDSSVPTRVDIKLRSRQMVETHLKLE